LIHPPGSRRIEVIDQRALPHVNTTVRITTADAAALAIRRMWVRGAPLIGAVGAYGLALALDADASDLALDQGARRARCDAADGGQPALGAGPRACRSGPTARKRARRRRVARSRRDRRRGCLDQSRDRRSRPAAAARYRREALGAGAGDDALQRGALATCGWGTATAALFLAHAEGISLHCWSARRGRACRARTSPHGNCASAAFHTRCSSTARAAC
jgi:methylthioribose-1-phosphate isomerase